MRKILLLFVVLLSVTFLAKSAEYVVYSSADLAAKVAAAIDGDIIKLGQTDSVFNQTALTVTKRITIKANTGLTAKPSVKLGVTLKNGSSIRLEGIKFFYDAPGSATATDSKYGITAVAEVASIDSIKIINCEALNFGRGLIRADNTTNIATIGTIVIDNCIISNASSVSTTYCTVGLKTAKVSNITVRNTTFVNCLSGVLYSEDTSTSLNLNVDHVTIYNCDKTGNKPIIGFRNPTGSKFSVTNSIVYFQGITTAAADTMVNRAINFSSVTPDAASFTLSNSIICPNQFTNKVLSLISPANTSAAWSAFNTVAVDSLAMDANYVVTTYPIQLNTIGDPRGYKLKSAVNSPKTSSTAISFNGTEIKLNETQNVSIFSVTGELLKSAKQVNQLSVANLSKGVYIVKAGTNVQKFIVK
ncbi:MAG: T9SS type A sorting domain-containing protein [Paludibacter sp.]